MIQAKPRPFLRTLSPRRRIHGGAGEFAHADIPRGLLRSWVTGVVATGGVLLSACSSLQVTQITHTSEKPSNIAVYFKVADSKGEPVPGMTAEQFNIYEDERLVSTFESKQTILNPEITSAHYTLLLVDMSGSVTESGELERIAEAADIFSSTVESNNKVAIYAFDGSPEIYEISGFVAPTDGSSRIDKVLAFRPKDNSTNLNGAVVAGLAKLDEALKEAKAPLRVGTLVVFTDGTDRASLVTTDEMKSAVTGSEHGVFAIGLGGEISEDYLKTIGKDGTALASDREKVVAAFQSVAKKIEASTKSYYLLSYCSPSRKGTHTVTIEAVEKDEKGKKKSSGKTEIEFDATGFGPDCDPNRAPKFDVSKGDALGGASASDKPKKNGASAKGKLAP